jgi:hypothetical protein
LKPHSADAFFGCQAIVQTPYFKNEPTLAGDFTYTQASVPRGTLGGKPEMFHVERRRTRLIMRPYGYYFPLLFHLQAIYGLHPVDIANYLLSAGHFV